MPGIKNATVVSTFNTDADGWFVQDIQQGTFNPVGTFSVQFSPTGGNPGGHIFAIDPTAFAFTLAAPAKFLGDKSSSIGEQLSFDLAIEAPVALPAAGDFLVFLRAAGEILVFDNPNVTLINIHPL